MVVESIFFYIALAVWYLFGGDKSKQISMILQLKISKWKTIVR